MWSFVSFVPRSETLSEGFDERYERTTDADGAASVVPPETALQPIGRTSLLRGGAGRPRPQRVTPRV